MDSTTTTNDRGRRSSRAGGGGLRRGRGNATPSVDLHALAVAYVFDALDERQREAFVAHLPDCPTCQGTLAIAPGPLAALTVAATPLAPPPPTLAAALRAVVIDVLPQTSQVEVAWKPVPPAEPEPDDEPDTEAAPTESRAASWLDAPAPGRSAPTSAASSSPSVGAAPSWDAWAHRGPASPDAGGDPDGAERSAVDSEGRPRPGLPAGMTGGWSVGDGAAPAARTIGGASWLVAGIAAVLVLALLVWGYRERSAIGDVEAELAAQRTVVAEIRANANASSFTMVPTEKGPASASGTAFFALPAMHGALTLEGMPSLPEGQAYQLWFIAADGVASPGPAARADAQGVVVIAFDATGLEVVQVYVTLAPLTGNTTEDFERFPALLVGILGGATR
jgi:hypothetical protein